MSMPLIPRWVFVAAVLIASVPCATLFLNHSVVKGVIVERLKTDTGIEITDLRIRLFPRLVIEFSNLVMRDDRQPDATVRVRQGSLTLRVLPLLRKQVAVVKVVAVEPQFVLRRDREGGWHVPLAGEPAPAAPGREGGFRLRWLLPDLQLTGGSILIVDEQGRETPHELRIQNVKGELDSDFLRTEAELALTGEVDEAGAPAAMTLAGTLSMEALSASSAIFDADRPPVRFEGSITIDRFDLAPWIHVPDRPGSREERPWHADLSARVLVMPGGAGYDTEISHVEARMDWVVVRGQGRIQDLGAEHPAYSATLSTSLVGLETALRLVPSAWIPPSVRSAASEHELTGTLELVSATLSGRMDRPEQGDWKGVAKLSQGGGLFGPDRTPVRNLSGTVFFGPARVDAMNLAGGVGALQVSDGTLALSHLDVQPALDLQLTGTGKMRALFELLRAFSGTAAGVTALNAIADPKGDVQVSIHIAGPLAPVPHIDLVRAEMTVHDFGARLPEWNLSAEHLDGTVGITPGFIELKHVRGSVGAILFDAQGAVQLGATPRFEDVTVEMSSEGAELRRFLSAKLSVASDVLLEGPTHATVHLSGPVSSPGWKGRIDMTELEVVVPPAIRKHRGVAAALEIEGTLIKGNRLAARRLALVLPLARVEGQADLRLGNRPDFTVRVKVSPLPLARLAEGFTIPPGTEGVFQGAITVTGRGLNWRSWTSSGFVELHQGAITIDGLRDRLREVSLRAQAAGRDAMIERVSFKLGDSDVMVRGLVKNWATRPVPTLTVESSRLDFSRLFSDGGTAEPDDGSRDRVRQWAQSGRAEITALVRQARYHRLLFTMLSGHLHVGEGKAEFAHLIGETPQGNLSGRIVATIRPRMPIEIEAEMKIDGMPVHQILSIIDPEAEPLRGLLSLTGGLHGTLSSAAPFLGTLNSRGPLTLRLDKGRVLHGTVLPKVLKVLNLPALLKGKVDLDHDGIPFDSVTATVTVLDGVLTSRNIVFDSPLVKITGAGTLDLPADELDLAIAVSPLGAYSDLIGKIPLFGRLLAGDRPGLSTALFEVKGPRSDPDIRYLPLESIAKGLTGYPRLAIDVLTNVFTLPGKLLSPDAP
ncbi:MAG: AsmA-like C-terminal domain-containing protein [Nitrospira sp.]|nr:AsmA-like C-terminal domain-containing protein [Nitrospira sp.]